MTKEFEFELVFEIPNSEFDAFEISDAVFEAGFEDALVGTGQSGLLGVELELSGDNAESVILQAAQKLIKALPQGTTLREVHPDLVSLADVAKKLNIKRQALQKRRMPPPSLGGLYRIDEVYNALLEADQNAIRATRFNLGAALSWLNAGHAARHINAQLTMKVLDPKTISKPKQPERANAA